MECPASRGEHHGRQHDRQRQGHELAHALATAASTTVTGADVLGDERRSRLAHGQNGVVNGKLDFQVDGEGSYGLDPQQVDLVLHDDVRERDRERLRPDGQPEHEDVAHEGPIEATFAGGRRGHRLD